MAKKASVKGLPRVELLDVLAKVSPALANNDLIPVLTHFWLNGETVTTFNDRIAIEHPIELLDAEGTVIEGAVPGTLLSILKNSKAREVSFSGDGDVLVVKAASTKMRLPILTPDSYTDLFSMPDTQGVSTVSFGGSYKDFLGSLSLCLKSVGNDASFQEHLGVTCVADDDGNLTLYATNNLTIVKDTVPVDVSGACRFILSPEFCKAFLGMFKDAPAAFIVADDYVLAESDDGLKLYGRLITTQDVTDFEEVLRGHLPKNLDKSAIPIPSKFEGILDRSLVVLGQGDDGVKVTLSSGMAAKKLVFVSSSDGGVIRDTLTVVDHPRCEALFSPKLLKLGAGNYEKMLFTDRVAAFIKEGGCYLISAFGG